MGEEDCLEILEAVREARRTETGLTISGSDALAAIDQINRAIDNDRRSHTAS